MSDEEKVKQAYALLRSVKDDVTRLFSVTFNRINNITAGERVITEGLIKEYGYDVVRDAFLAAVAESTDKHKLSYIRACAVNIAKDRIKEKKLEEHKIAKAEFSRWKPAEDNQWKELLAFMDKKVKMEDRAGNEGNDHKDTERYKKMRREFYENLKSEGL